MNFVFSEVLDQTPADGAVKSDKPQNEEMSTWYVFRDTQLKPLEEFQVTVEEQRNNWELVIVVVQVTPEST